MALCDEIEPGAHMSMVSVGGGSSYVYQERTSPEMEILDPAFAPSGSFSILLVMFQSLLMLVWPRLRLFSNATISRLRETDFVVAKGGYVYRERGGRGGLLSGWLTMWPFLYAKRCGAVGIVYSASVGPWDSKMSRWLSALSLRRADVICPRDPDSLVRLETEIQPEGVVEDMPDCVFGLLHDRQLVPGDDSEARNRLVIMPRREDNSSDHWIWFTHTARTLTEAFPDLVPTVVTQSTGDEPAAREIAELLGLGGDSVHVPQTPDQTMGLYQQGALSFSARMHGTILSLMAGMAGLLVEFDPGKSAPVFRNLDLEWVVVESGMDVTKVVETAQNLLSPEIVEDIARRVAEACDIVTEHRRHIADLARALRFGPPPE